MSKYNFSNWFTCPSCNKAPLFSGLISVQDICPNCNFALSEHNLGDGAQYIGIFVLCFILTSLAVLVELTLNPSILTHILLWTPISIILTILSLRVSKAMLIQIQYNTNIGAFKNGKRK